MPRVFPLLAEAREAVAVLASVPPSLGDGVRSVTLLWSEAGLSLGLEAQAVGSALRDQGASKRMIQLAQSLTVAASWMGPEVPSVLRWLPGSFSWRKSSGLCR